MSDNFLPVAISTFVPTVTLSPEEFQRMEACGCKLTPAMRERISEAMNDYLHKAHIRTVWPKANRQLRRHLLKTADQSQSLAKLLDFDGSEASQGFQFLITKYSRIERKEQDWLIRKLYHIGVSARHVEKYLLKGRSGPTKDPYIKPLVQELHEIFREAGGRGRYWKDAAASPYRRFKGNLFTFVSVALEGLPASHRRSNQALGKVFEQARLPRK